jgi:ketosteroid isomerase-like protein
VVPTKSDSQDEAEIRRLIADQQKAVCAKDIDGIMAHYAADVIVFNVKPPFQTRGAKEWRGSGRLRCRIFSLRSE